MSHGPDRRRPFQPIRLATEGTRVVLLAGEPRAAGVITEVRPEPHLKTYVVACDDGRRVFASGYDLAREGDGAATPLAPRPDL